jgi:hypothetical protein
MDIRIENEINNLIKMGFDETVAGIITSNKYKKQDEAEALITLEQNNQKILQEETLKYLVPMSIVKQLTPTFPVKKTLHSITEDEQSTTTKSSR